MEQKKLQKLTSAHVLMEGDDTRRKLFCIFSQ